VAVGAGNLSTWNGAQLQTFLTARLLEGANAERLIQIRDQVESFAAGQLVESVQARIGQLQSFGAASAQRRSRSVTLWKARTKITRFGQKKLVLKPTRRGLKLLRRIAKTNVRLRKRHRRPVRLRMTVRNTFKPRHGKKVTVAKRVRTRSRRR
jgi:hypothetical protein